MKLLGHQKYNNPPPEGQLCERCNELPCGTNYLGKKMWICNTCADKDFKAPQLLPNKARGTSTKRRHKDTR